MWVVEYFLHLGPGLIEDRLGIDIGHCLEGDQDDVLRRVSAISSVPATPATAAGLTTFPSNPHAPAEFPAAGWHPECSRI